MSKISNKHTQLDIDNFENYSNCSVLIPAKIYVAQSKEFKDGTPQYLIFASPIGATSKEKPSLGTVRAKDDKEAVKLAQKILDENLASFLEYCFKR